MNNNKVCMRETLLKIHDEAVKKGDWKSACAALDTLRRFDRVARPEPPPAAQPPWHKEEVSSAGLLAVSALCLFVAAWIAVLWAGL